MGSFSPFPKTSKSLYKYKSHEARFSCLTDLTIQSTRSIENSTKMNTNGKIENFWKVRLFRWGHFRHSQKNPKISTNTNRTKLNLCELNSVGDILQFDINLVLGKFCKRKPFDLNIFLSHI